ncbi:hypothetical protein GGE65_008133 [Skermanella aerolata]
MALMCQMREAVHLITLSNVIGPGGRGISAQTIAKRYKLEWDVHLMTKSGAQNLRYTRE